MKARTWPLWGCLLWVLLLALGGAAPAQADRSLISETAVKTRFCLRCPPPPPDLEFLPPPEGQIEGACGVAVAGSDIYVSDYYHRDVHVFPGGAYLSTIKDVAPAPEGPCGLAAGPGDALYANIWHQRVVRLKPTFQTFDTGHSTGVAVDGAGNVYVNDRTYVAVYEPSGAPVLDGGEPLKIGLGSLGDGFGVAVDSGRVYVPDAADGTVKVYEPATDPLVPADVIDGAAVPGGGFVSLVDASVAVDPTNGHLLVVDNLKPGYEHPQAAVYEFDSTGAFLGQLPEAAAEPEIPAGPIHGEPSGIAVDPTNGVLYVTDGNSEGSNVFAYGPYTPGDGLEAGAPPPGGEDSLGSAAAGQAAGAMDASATVLAPSSSRLSRPARRSRKKARRGRGGVAVWGAVALHGRARR